MIIIIMNNKVIIMKIMNKNENEMNNKWNIINKWNK